MKVPAGVLTDVRRSGLIVIAVILGSTELVANAAPNRHELAEAVVAAWTETRSEMKYMNYEVVHLSFAFTAPTWEAAVQRESTLTQAWNGGGLEGVVAAEIGSHSPHEYYRYKVKLRGSTIRMLQQPIERPSWGLETLNTPALSAVLGITFKPDGEGDICSATLSGPSMNVGGSLPVAPRRMFAWTGWRADSDDAIYDNQLAGLIADQGLSIADTVAVPYDVLSSTTRSSYRFSGTVRLSAANGFLPRGSDILATLDSQPVFHVSTLVEYSEGVLAPLPSRIMRMERTADSKSGTGIRVEVSAFSIKRSSVVDAADDMRIPLPSVTLIHDVSTPNETTAFAGSGDGWPYHWSFAFRPALGAAPTLGVPDATWTTLGERDYLSARRATPPDETAQVRWPWIAAMLAAAACFGWLALDRRRARAPTRRSE